MDENKEVLRLSLPLVGQNIVYTFMSIFDIMLIGNYVGSTAVSVVGLSNSLVNTFINIFVSAGVAVGIMSMVSKYVGAKRYGIAVSYAFNGIILGLIISLSIVILMLVFNKSFLYLMGARSEILNLSVKYTYINTIANFFYMLCIIFNSIMFAFGNSVMSLYIAIFQFVSKMIFNYIFINFIFKNESLINLPAITSFIVYGLSLFIFLFYFLYKYKSLKPYKSYINIGFKALKDILFLSIPSSLEESSYSISRLIGTSMIMVLGGASFAANEIANTVETVSLTPGFAFGIAATNLVGMNVGRRDSNKAKRVAHNCGFWTLVIMCSLAMVFFFMPNILVSLFISPKEKQIAYKAGKCLAIGAFEQPFIGMSTIFGGALKGLGHTKTTFYVSSFTAWVIRLPLIYYFIYKLKLDITVLWWITTVQWAVDALLMYILFLIKVRNVEN